MSAIQASCVAAPLFQFVQFTYISLRHPPALSAPSSSHSQSELWRLPATMISGGLTVEEDEVEQSTESKRTSRRTRVMDILYCIGLKPLPLAAAVIDVLMVIGIS